jgi:hypothetical protein
MPPFAIWLTTELQSVLRPSDYAVFDFDQAVARLLELSEVLKDIEPRS